MTPAARLAQLAEDAGLVPDAHERLSWLAAWGNGAPELAAEARGDDQLVPGCVSRVWLDGRREDGRMRFRVAADSPMVRGLAGVTVRLADGCGPEELESADLDWPARLRLDRMITPTRLNGLAAVAARLRQLARLS